MKTLSLHILDLVHNSISANAKRIEILVEENTNDNFLTIKIKDNGKGMSEEMVKLVTDPFVTSRKSRKVGLGISLFKQNAEICNGEFSLKSEEGKGTEIEAKFERNHWDRPKLGDMADLVVGLASSTENVEFVYVHQYNDKKYEFDTLEVKEALDGLPIRGKEITDYLKEMIHENVKEITI